MMENVCAGKCRCSFQFEITSPVENYFIDQSGRQPRYADAEKIAIVEVPDFPTLGKLTALRFLEWVLANPEGVISLPTGKTPEYFIRWVRFFLEQWNSKTVQAELDLFGMAGSVKPDLSRLHFVQIDEFYPIEPTQHNSFHYYVMKHYIRGFGLDPSRALLIDPTRIGLPEDHSLDMVFPDGQVDLSLRSRQATDGQEALQQQVIQAVDQFCTDYESRIREMGGIGFFLGGIGPDGHIGFNARGSHHYSPTRLTLTNYETEAAAASDLGGIEIARHKPVITIGLGTITYNPDATVIIFAAGEAKARVIADAIQQQRHVNYPASVLHGMPNARVYLTTGASVQLTERKLARVLELEEIPEEMVERCVVDRAVGLSKRLDELTVADLKGDRLLASVIEKTGGTLPEWAVWTRERLLEKINRGLETPSEQVILHTGPHHDDIMLGYMPSIMHLVRKASNHNYFAIMTSGFTAVTNRFLAEVLGDLHEFLEAGEFVADQAAGLFFEDKASRAEEVYRYLDGIAARDQRMCRRAQARRMLFNLMNLYEEDDLDNIQCRLEENLHYLRTLYPGKKDISLIQKMKGMQREYEEELIWGYVGTAPHHVYHLRLGFYTGDIFTQTPTVDRDVEPVLNLLREIRPDRVSVAFDPEGSGPDTHYKVLQVLNEALQKYHTETGASPLVLGYRNVWYRFHPAEANLFIPATLNTMAVQDHSFMHCFGSQRSASFPSYEFDGPFSQMAQKIWVEQFQILRTCLGERFFIENEHPQLRATRGFVFLRAMDLAEFAGAARSLARAVEAINLPG